MKVPSIPYLRLRVVLEACEPVRLPPYSGSMLRGAFGHALRAAVCTMGPDQPCPSCPLRRACVYTRLFECLNEGEPPPFLRGLRTAPRPYVFEPHSLEAFGAGPSHSGQDLAEGDELGFDLVLLGQAIELHGYAVVALERMAGRGLGGRRRRFRLRRVDHVGPEGDGRALYEEGRWASSTPAPAPAQTVPATLPDDERLSLELLTPLRLFRDERRLEEFRFRELAFRMLRRVLELAFFHVPDAAISWEIRPLLELADRIEIVTQATRAVDWQRYSQRQQRSMSLGGLIGRLDLRGELAPFADLLRTAEVVHTGKGATFGLGWMRIDGR